MALPKACTIIEQNVNTIAGIQIDTAIYVGTGIAGVPSLRVGREAPVYRLDSIQTAAVMDIVLETQNAYAGAQFNIRFGTGATGTSTIRIINATTGGTVVSTATAPGLLGVEHDILATFNGVAWR